MELSAESARGLVRLSPARRPRALVAGEERATRGEPLRWSSRLRWPGSPWGRLAWTFATRAIGSTGLHVTQLGCGGATLGDIREVIPESQADVTLEGAYAAGIGYFDTAPWYGNGRSEHRLGRILGAKPRESYVLSTKIGRVFFRPPDPQAYVASRPSGERRHPKGGRGAALRPALRLHPRRSLPLLRGQPAAPGHQHRGRPPDPRPRPGLP